MKYLDGDKSRVKIFLLHGRLAESSQRRCIISSPCMPLLGPRNNEAPYAMTESCPSI